MEVMGEAAWRGHIHVFCTGTSFDENERQLCLSGGLYEKGEAVWRGHNAISIIIFGTGTSCDKNEQLCSNGGHNEKI
jgi:hypothetical protein